MKKTVLALVVAIITVVSASSAQFTWQDGRGLEIQSEEVALTPYQINEIVQYGEIQKPLEYEVYHYDMQTHEEYWYTVHLTEEEDRLIQYYKKHKK